MPTRAARRFVTLLLSGPLAWPCVAPVTAAPTTSPADWPTLHRDAQRSGHTDYVVEGPYERKWFRDFHDEGIASRVEAIVAGGRCFVGTFAGNLHAVNVADGSTAWTFKAAGPIGHAACYRDGRVYVGSEGGAFDRGYVYCLNVTSGHEHWRFEAGAGVWVAPAVDADRVYFGDRAGVFRAVSIADGREAWRVETGGPILTPASISEDGTRVVFAAEDMHIYCVDAATGRVAWKSRKLAGVTVRDHPPSLWRGLAVVRTAPADSFHAVLDRNGKLLGDVQRRIPLNGPGAPAGEAVLLDKWGDYVVTPSPARRKAEQDAILQYLKDNPADQTFHAFALADGSEPWVAPVLYTGGLHNSPTAPTFDPKTGRLYTFCRTALTHYLRGVRRYSAWATVDRDTGRLDNYWPEQDAAVANWRAFPMIGDETQALSLMGRTLVGTHQGHLGLIDLGTGRAQMLWDARDTYGGIYGPALAGGMADQPTPESERARREGRLVTVAHEWHGPDRSILAVADRRLFWVVGSQVVCLGGPDTPRAESGGTKPPPPIQRRIPNRAGGGNVVRGADDADPVPAPAGDEFRADEALKLLLTPVGTDGAAAANGPVAARVRAALDRQVIELIDGGPWAPLVVQLGISGEERHFWRTAETMQVLAGAVPHLSPPVREKAVAHLKQMWRDGCPLATAAHPPTGNRRERYDLGPASRKFAAADPPRKAAAVEDLYAVWAYAEYASGWDDVLAKLNDVQRVYASAPPLKFDPAKDPEAAERLNARLAGVIGYARIMAKANRPNDRAAAEQAMLDLARLRVEHEATDRRLIRPLGRLHAAVLPRYGGLVLEVAALLAAQAPTSFRRNVTDLTTELPLWYQSWGERMIGGENFTTPPHVSRGLFMATVHVGGQARTRGSDPQRDAGAESLLRYLDQPWSRADLAYIEKCTAALWAAPGRP